MIWQTRERAQLERADDLLALAEAQLMLAANDQLAGLADAERVAKALELVRDGRGELGKLAHMLDA